MENLTPLQTWLYDHLPIGVAVLDLQLNYRYANAAYAATRGYSAEQMLGKPLTRSEDDWVALIMKMVERARETLRAVEEYDVALTYPRQPSLQRIWDVTLLPLTLDDALDGFIIYLVDVTSRQQAEQLSASAARMRSILDVAADAILVIDQDGTVLQVNPATERIFGYQTGELIDQPITTIMPSPYREEHPQFLSRYLHTDIPHIIGTVREVQGRRKNGSIFPCELSVAESRESAERRIFVGIIRDITEQKHTVESLEGLYRQRELILSAAGEGIFGLDSNGRITFSNPATSALMGYSEEELLHQVSHTLFHYAKADGSPYPIEECPIYAAYMDGTVHHVTGEVFWRIDGTSFPVDYISTPIRSQGEIIGAVVTFNDITERRRLENALETARARLEAILDTVPIPLFVVEPNEIISLANDAAREFYGEWLSTGTIFQSVRLHPDTRAPWPAKDWPILRALHEGRVFDNVEQIVIFPDGTEVHILANAAPVIVEGQIIAAVGVAQDISQLKAADRAKDAFLALISHELRSPLATITSWASIALEDASLQREALEIVVRNAEVQRRIVDDLLDLSRVVYGKLTLEMQQVDAWEIAERTVTGMRTSIENRQLTITLNAPAEPLPVMADPVRLGQIISNLLTNAAKFTPGGGIITVEGTRDGREARLRVRDTGRGIPPEQLPLIFQRFQQLGRERESGGLGLGLALVKGLVELHHGRVAVYSAGIDQGSTFTVWLPLRDERKTG